MSLVQSQDAGSVYDVFWVVEVVGLLEPVLDSCNRIHVLGVLADCVYAVLEVVEALHKLVDVVVDEVVLEDCRQHLACVLLDVLSVALVSNFLAIWTDFVLSYALIYELVVEEDVVDVLHIVEVVFYRKLGANQEFQVPLADR